MVPNSVGDITITKTQEGATVWLIGDRYGERRKQFQRQGWQIGFSKSGSTRATQRSTWLRRLSEDKPRLLYIVEFGGMDNSNHVSSFLGNMVDDQLKLCGLI